MSWLLYYYYFPYPYTLQEDLIIEGQVISSSDMLCDPKYVFVKISYQCIKIINNKERLNGLKGITKIQSIESLFKYQSRI